MKTDFLFTESFDVFDTKLLSTHSKLAVCIPTYNNPDFIDELLTQELPLYFRNDVLLCIFDSSGDDKTQAVVNKFLCTYSNLFYFHLDVNIHSNDKVYSIYSMVEKYKFCDYVWVRTDAIRIDSAFFELLFGKLNNSFDFLILNPEVHFSESVKVYTDINNLLVDCAWRTTAYGDAILNVSKMLTDNDWNFYEKLYGTDATKNFSHVCFYFHKIAFSSNPVVYFIGVPSELFYGSPLKKNPSWENMYFKIWSGIWPAAILSLPDCYQMSSKIASIRGLGKNAWIYSRTQLDVLAQEHILTESVFSQYKDLFEKYSGVPLFWFYDACKGYAFIKDESLKDFCGKYKTIVIYGAGKKAKKTMATLNYYNIPFDSFVVSGEVNLSDIENHPVVAFKDYVFTENVGIVMGMNFQNCREVLCLLGEKHLLSQTYGGYNTDSRYLNDFFNRLNEIDN